MSRFSRLLTAALVAVASVAVASVGGTAAVVAPADAVVGPPSIRVHGRLLVVPSELPSGRARYGVALAGGDIVPVRGRFGPDVRSGAIFDGRLSVPTSVLTTLARRDESGTAAALRLADRRSLTLSVVGMPSVTAPTISSAVTPTTHPQFVAALSNKGTLQTDPQLLAHVSTVGDYWTAESNGVISGITVPATVMHYNTTLKTADCGLGSDFFDVVQEAAEQFPTLDLSQPGPDQLVVFVPQSCPSGGIVGEGTVGQSFASGGALVVKAGDSIEGTYAHETGHNYGFEHANARYAGSSLEYYGVYDVMGFALPPPFNQLTALSTPYRVFQGVTDPGEIQDVSPGTGPDPVHVSTVIKPRSDDSGVRSVRIQNPDTGEHLYLDYRSGTGQDLAAFYTQTGLSLSSGRGPLYYAPGVTINAARSGSGVDTLVVDKQGDTSLGAGTSWRNASGDLRVTVTSLASSGADVSIDYAPLITPAPTPKVTGTPRVGRTLSVAPGNWMSGVTLHVQWYVGSSAVPGATGTTYTPRARDLGKRVRLKVTGTKSGYASVTRTSHATSAVAPGALTSSRPTIGGKAKVGRSLKARHHAWSSGTTFSYRWYASGRRIKHATAATLRLTRAQTGKRITVKVTGKKRGYTTVSRISAPTRKVRGHHQHHG
jgi:hypothetical protein